MKPGKVRPLALAIIWRGAELLVAEGYDPRKGQTFYRPLGGKIEFGESGRDTVVRELREEIQQTVTVGRCLGALENIFTYNGQPGHEIVLLFEAVFADAAVYEQATLTGTDDDEVLFTTRWLPLDFFRGGAAPLYPDGLLDLLT